MVDLARPMLAEALAALTPETYIPAWEAVAPRVRLALDAALLAPPDGAEVRPGGARWEWTVAGPDEAQETLVARGLLPEGWCDVARRGWWCAVCGGTGNGGSLIYGTAPCAACCPDLDRPWERRGRTSAPRTIPPLVSVASLGLDAILRAEELARAACAALREYGCPQPERVVWRVGERARADALLWRDSIYNRVQVSVRGVVLVNGRLDVRPERRVVAGIEALWLSGLALDAITADAVRIVVPPVGGAP